MFFVTFYKNTNIMTPSSKSATCKLRVHAPLAANVAAEHITRGRQRNMVPTFRLIRRPNRAYPPRPRLTPADCRTPPRQRLRDTWSKHKRPRKHLETHGPSRAPNKSYSHVKPTDPSRAQTRPTGRVTRRRASAKNAFACTYKHRRTTHNINTDSEQRKPRHN